MQIQFTHQAVQGRVSGLIKNYMDLHNQLDDVKKAIDELDLDFREKQSSHAYKILDKERDRLNAEISCLLDTKVQVEGV